MANTIAKLAVIVTANASQAISALGGLSNKVRGFGGGLAKYMGAGFLAGGAFGAIAGVVGGMIPSVGDLSSKFGEVASAIKETSMSAKRLGATTEDLMGLQYVASKTGVDVEQLNKAMFHMSRHKSGDAMENLLQAADKYADAPNKAAFAFENFSKAGYAMSSMLAKGRGGIKALMDEAKSLGLVMTDLDAEKVVAAKKELGKLGVAMTGLYNKAIVAISPAIAALAGLINRFLVPVVVFVGEVASRAFALWGYTVEYLSNLIGTLAGELLGGVGLKGAMTWLLDAMDRWMLVVQSIGDALLPIFLAIGRQGIAVVLEWGRKLSEWITGHLGEWPTVEQVALGVFRSIGVAGAYAFDAVVAGVGFAAIGLGRFIGWLGSSVQAVTKWVSHSLEATSLFRKGWYSAIFDTLKQIVAPFAAVGMLIVWWTDKVVDPAVSRMRDSFTRLLEWVKPVMEALLGVQAKIAKAVGGEALRQYQQAQGAFDEFVSVMERKGSEGGPAVNLVDDIDAQIKGVMDRAGKFGEDMEALGKNLDDWGQARVDGFGQSADAVNKFFDDLKMKQRQAEKMKGGPGFDWQKPEYHATAAMLQGSKEALSIGAKFRFEGQNENTQMALDKKRNALAAEANDILKDVKAALNPLANLKVI